MNPNIYIIDPVVEVVSTPNGVQPVGGFFSALGSFASKVGSKIGTVASKLGTVFKSPVMSKILEGGLAIGGSLLASKLAGKGQAGIATPYVPTPATPPPTGMSTTTKYLVYGGIAVASVALIYVIMSRRKR